MTNKKLKQEPVNFTKLEDRLTSLPESLQVHILSNLEAKYVVQTSVLSKSWVSLWKLVPFRTLDSYSFQNLRDFDRFVKQVVCRSVSVDTLIFKRGGSSSKYILEKVISYACSSNVKHLDLWIERAKQGEWPVSFHGCPDSLKSLELHSQDKVLCSYLGPRARLFKNLTELYLHHATIQDLDPFSGFRVLNKLTLFACEVDTSGKTLCIHSNHLSELSMILGTAVFGFGSREPTISCIELMTPKLRMFVYEGDNFPLLKTCDGLPNLDSVVIGSPTVRYIDNKKIKFDNLMKFLTKVYNVKSLKVWPDIVYILGSCSAELVNRCTPFHDLKTLTIDFGDIRIYKIFGRNGYWSDKAWEDARSNVKDYLLRKSPVTNFIS